MHPYIVAFRAGPDGAIVRTQAYNATQAEARARVENPSLLNAALVYVRRVW